MLRHYEKMLGIRVHTWGEMTNADHVPDGQQTIGSDSEFLQMSFGRKMIFQKDSNLSSWDVSEIVLSVADKNRAVSVLFHCFDIDDLAPVNMQDCHRVQLTPFVPVVGHSHLVSQSPGSL